MCGIVGAFKPQGGAVSGIDTIISMRDSMIHRGPDGGGVWQDPNRQCTLGHRRLSIIDLSTAAMQPMSNENESVVVVFNGEIYNHADIRETLKATGKYRWKTDHSDTEVLLHAFEEWGMECLHRFYGMFAFAILDRRVAQKPVLHLARDRMGVKPLYFTKLNSGEWLFASEIKAILAHPSITPEMDKTAFWHYLTFIVAPAPLTMFRGIFKLPNGYRMTIDHRGIAKSERWYQLLPSRAATLSERDISFDGACDELLSLLRKSVARRMVSDVPFGALLSGGVDSSLNVALMAEQMDRPVTTFSIGYEGYDQLNEFQYARRIAKQYGTDHHEREITTKEVLDFLPQLPYWQDEPIADNVCIPLYFLSDLVRKTGTTVVQVGEGADEHFLGYWWCDHYQKKYESIYAPIRNGATTPWWKRLLHKTPVAGNLARTLAGEDVEFSRRAARGEPLFWGGAACFTGDMRRELTPNAELFRQQVDCPVPGLMTSGLESLDSAAVCASHYAELGKLANPEILQQISFLEGRMRLPEHLLMRVDKMTMAHSIEARVPFLDHDVVEFAARLPLSYKLNDGLGKRIVKKIAERFVDHDILYRQKQGFGAPIDRWFSEGDFGKRCLVAFQTSGIAKSGLLNNEYFEDMLRHQIAGTRNSGFHIWTVLNAVLWHSYWIEGRKDCL